MDDLLSLLMMAVIVGLSVWRKQKKQAEQAAKKARKQRAFSDMAEMEQAKRSAAPAPSPEGRPAKPIPAKEDLPRRPEAAKPLLKAEKKMEAKVGQAIKTAVQSPIAREMLAQFMPELNDADFEPAPAESKPVQLKMDLPPKKPAAVQAVKIPPHLDHDEPEGSVSTQGESAEEHAEHRRRILAEEAKIRMDHEALQEVRSMNLQKLRTAVVMSEILDKPVSLRRRRTY